MHLDLVGRAAAPRRRAPRRSRAAGRTPRRCPCRCGPSGRRAVSGLPAASSTPASRLALRSQVKQRAQAWQASVISRARSSSASSRSAMDSGGAELADLVDEPAGAAVDHRVAHARAPRSATRRHAVRGRLDDRQPQPSATEVLVVSQARRSSSSRTSSGWKPWKVTTSAEPQLGDERVQARPLRAVADDVDPQLRLRRAAATASWPSSRSTRLCGTSRETTVIVGSGSRGTGTSGVAELPLGTTWIGPRKPRRRRSSCRVDGDTATIGRPRRPRGCRGSRGTGPPRRAPGRTAWRTGPGGRGARPARPARRARRTAGRRTGCRSGSRRRSRCGRSGAAAPGPRAGRCPARRRTARLDSVDHPAVRLPRGRARSTT